jgi:hypothetical protein
LLKKDPTTEPENKMSFLRSLGLFGAFAVLQGVYGGLDLTSNSTVTVYWGECCHTISFYTPVEYTLIHQDRPKLLPRYGDPRTAAVRVLL